jgi:hypothetical protein
MGLRRDGRQLWIGPDQEAAYLVSLDNAQDVERWPRPSGPSGARKRHGALPAPQDRERLDGRLAALALDETQEHHARGVEPRSA